jgi:hypothetical protein
VEVNPYEAPAGEDQRQSDNVVKPFPIRYLLLVVASIPLGAINFGWLLLQTSWIDDCGGLQMIVGALGGLVSSLIYVCWKVWGPSRSPSV